jgi:5'-nucleotidase (lipoprotein e(P4) family)
MTWKTLGSLFTGAALGITAMNFAPRTTAEAPPALAKEDPQYRSLDANLYVQASAEYRACCLQAYNLAKVRLVEKLAQRKDGAKPAAVVLDLDETVFDNSGYQAMIARSGLGFDLRLFDWWEATQGDLVEAVPGALEFLAFAKEKGVALCYISNRSNVPKCHDVLKRMNIDVPESQLKLSMGPSEKDTRRGEIKKDFDVLLYVGDNLRDFEDYFRYEKDIEKLTIPDARTRIPLRNKVVDDNAAKFGSDWIILPNPMYGEWTKPFGRGTADLEFLRPVKKKS